MNPAPPEALLAELAQCHALLKDAAARLWAVASAMNAAAGGLGQEISPNDSGSGNIASDIFPNGQQPGKSHGVDFPNQSSFGEDYKERFPQSLPVGEKPVVLPSVPKLIAVLRRQAFPPNTHSQRIRRAAQLMLSLKTEPGAYGVAHFAKLLHMSYSGAGKAMMGYRQVGIIKRSAYKVYVLTQKGEELLQEAIDYVPPVE